MMKLCETCEFWKKNTHSWSTSGVCSELLIEKVTIELVTGWDGGYVDYIETENNFGCVLHSDYKKDKKQEDGKI